MARQADSPSPGGGDRAAAGADEAPLRVFRRIDWSFRSLRCLADLIAGGGGGTIEGLIHRRPAQLRIGLLGDAERPCLPRSLYCLPQLGQVVDVDHGHPVRPSTLKSAARHQPTQPAH
jgi:hypothetical protein